MSEASATLWAAIIGVIGIFLVAVVSGMLAWMFSMRDRISKLEGRVTGLGQQLRNVPKRKGDYEGREENDESS